MSESVLVTGKRISDMELLANLSGSEKIPTGTANDNAVTPEMIRDYSISSGSLVTKPTLDSATNDLQLNIDSLEDVVTGNANTASQGLGQERQERIAGDNLLNSKITQLTSDVDLKLDGKVDKEGSVKSVVGLVGDVTTDQVKTALDLGDLSTKDQADVLKDELLTTWANRTQKDKNLEVITAEDFGAIGDTVADDTSSFDALEASHQGINIDLQGKTYRVTKDFNKNHYFNGNFRINNSNKGKGVFQESPSKYVSGNGNGQKFGEIIVPLYDDEVATSSTILQSVYYLEAENRIYTQRVLRGTGATEEVIIDCFDYGTVGVVGAVPLWTSKPLTCSGHQSVAVQRGGVGGKVIWTTTGSAKYEERSRFVTRLKIDETTGVESDIEYFKVFPDEFVGNNTPVMTVSPNAQFLVCTATSSTRGRMARVYRLVDLVSGGDYSDQYLYEFGFGSYGTSAPQSVCCDGEFIYFLHGGDSTTKVRVEVFTLDGSFVSLDENCTTGYYDSTLLDHKYYEPESLFIGDQNKLMLCTAVGKKGGINARDSYTNYLHSIRFHPTKMFVTDAGRPLTFFNGQRAISHPSTRPLRFSALSSAGVFDDYLNISQRSSIYAPTEGSYNISVVVKGNAQPQIRVKSDLADGLLQVSTGGNFGLFDLGTSKWVAGLNTNGKSFTQFDFEVSGDVLPNNNNTRSLGSSTVGWSKAWLNQLNIKSLQVFADNATAITGGLVVGDVYRTSTGQLMVVF